jgi:hypothetical protein
MLDDSADRADIKTVTEMIIERFPELAPCGIFCEVCPSYGKSCLGCSSEDQNQTRKSKWACRLRKCCYSTEELNYCVDCDKFPCKAHRQKLLDSHPGDARFAYRRDVDENFRMLRELGFDDLRNEIIQNHTCPACQGLIYFYHYTCSQCGKIYLSE